MTLPARLNFPHLVPMMPEAYVSENVVGGLSSCENCATLDLGHSDSGVDGQHEFPDMSGWNLLQSGQDAELLEEPMSWDVDGSLDPISQFDDVSTLGVNRTASVDESTLLATVIDDSVELGPSLQTEIDEETGTFPGEGMLTADTGDARSSSVQALGVTDAGLWDVQQSYVPDDSNFDLFEHCSEQNFELLHDQQTDGSFSLVSAGGCGDVFRDSELGRLARGEAGTSAASSRGTLAVDVGVQRAYEQLKPEVPKFVWETSAFLRQVFGSDPIMPLPIADTRPRMPIDVEAPVSVRELLKRPRTLTTASLSDRTLKFYPEKEDKDRRCSILSDWASLVAVAPNAFRVGRFIVEDKEEMTHDNIRRSVEMCFTGKATSTLAKRFYSINRFLTWCVKTGACPFPVRERDVLRHLEGLDSDKCAPSAGQSLLEAIRFGAALLGMDEDLSSKGQTRVQGLATKMSLRAGPIVQAAPLTVAQVCKLERLVVESDDFRDKVTLGGIMILLYSCGRISDGQRAVEAIFDGGMADIDHLGAEVNAYYELRVVGNKAVRSETLKRSILPLVAPIFSLSNVAWFNSWAQARSICGLPVSGRLAQPFLCRCWRRTHGSGP